LEAAAIMRGLARAAYLLQTGEPFLLWTDHCNLVYVFETSDVKSHMRQKLERWALKLQSSSYKYNILKEKTVYGQIF
jgi:hypothetical protein